LIEVDDHLDPVASLNGVAAADGAVQDEQVLSAGPGRRAALRAEPDGSHAPILAYRSAARACDLTVATRIFQGLT
jgi:hypothetical protein